MTNEEMAIINEIANKLLLLCATSEVEQEKFEEQAKALRSRWNVYKPTDAGKNADLQRNSETETSAILLSAKKEKEMERLKDCKMRVIRGCYEIRYRKNGYDMSFSSKDLDKAKAKASKWLRELNAKYKGVMPTKSRNKKYYFGPFATEYMEKIKKRRVKPATYSSYDRHFRNKILPRLENYYIKDITTIILQDFLDEVNSVAPRVCEDVKTLLNNIFEYAIVNGVIERNPMSLTYVEKHVRKNGCALTLEEEKELLQAVKGKSIELAVIVALYTGARPSEIQTVTFNREENTLTIKNSKLKSYQKNEYRTIPIFPKLQPYLDRLTSENWRGILRENTIPNFSRFTKHAVKDLRHTFTTRAKECRILDEVVAIWTGHSISSLTARVYTHYSYEFMQDEAKKLVY